ncbi:hypothetical protein AB0D54_22960 [Streptomyces xanthophaeus]|uniref:hypothetical protein n=1 Tax=Streptomyces xanthophaeus TaxID=67385 RepID=UPI00343ECC76
MASFPAKWSPYVEQEPGELLEGVEEPSFLAELKQLYEAAGGREVGYTKLISLGKKQGLVVRDATISGWMTGTSTPSAKHGTYVLQVLLPELERLATQRSPAHRPVSPEGWRSRLRAAQKRGRSRQGGRGPRIDADSAGRLYGHPAEVCQTILPLDFAGREQELDELAVFASQPPGRGSGYLWWQADAWAGKSALLAWFALRCLPTGVDAAVHFIAERLGTNHRDDFLRNIADQLAIIAGKKPSASRPRRPDQLFDLYEAAAKASAARGRTLLLLVDGLDEDAGARPGGQSIAALLPKHVPSGMRVIVAGRPNPPVPDDVPADHPLRQPLAVRRLPASPAARVIRDMALRDLYALLDDPHVGCHLLGLLTAARGALGGWEMAELVGVRPYDVDKKLRSVVGRSMAPGRADRLQQGGQDSGRLTYVLAHEELRRAAADALGEAELAGYEARLHTWADRYRDRGWPDGTPDYLLTGYTRLLQYGAATGRLAELVLDAVRQLRLVARFGAEMALAELDPVLTAHTGDSRGDLAVAAGAAASREFLEQYVPPLPRSVLRAVARLGDPGYARALALAAPHPSSKADALTDVARVLAETSPEQAQDLAREAAVWATRGRRQAFPLPGDEDVAEAVAARAAVALIATGEEETGLELLRSTWGMGTARYEAWTEAARLLRQSDPARASELLDEMEARIEDLHDSYNHGYPSDQITRIQVWTILAAASPERADRIHDHALAHARAVWAQRPTLENVAVLAAVASMLADARPKPAAALAETARAYVDSVWRQPGSMSKADRSHMDVAFELTLERLVEALADTKFPMDGIRTLLDAAPEEFRAGRTGPFQADVTGFARTALTRIEAGEADDGDGFRELDRSEAGRLAAQALDLAERGREDEAELRLGEALEQLRAAGSGKLLPTGWLPALVGSLGRIGMLQEAEELAAGLPRVYDQACALAALSLAHTDADRADEARRAAAAAGECANTHPMAWPAAAQALAWAGAGAEAEELIARTEPSDGTARAGWLKDARQARIAVAEGLAAQEPTRAAALVDEERERLLGAVGRPRGLAALLPALAGLLPAAARMDEPCRERLEESLSQALEYENESPHSWQTETVLVHALLRIRNGEDPAYQLDWLARAMRAYPPEHLPMAGIAVLHALLGDTDEAWWVADASATPAHRASALAAVAGHLARVPVRLVAFRRPAGAEPLTRTICAIALATSTHIRANTPSAARFARQALAHDGWHHALPVLARIAPEAVAKVHDIARTHLRNGVFAGTLATETGAEGLPDRSHA